MLLPALLTLLVTLLAPDAEAGTIYKFVDSSGLIHYTNKPDSDFIGNDGQSYLLDQHSPIVSKSIFRFKNRTYTFKDFGSNTLHYASANKKRFTDLIEQTALKYQLDPKLVHAVIQTESAYDASAISSAGAIGLMQLMPDTAKRFGVNDPTNPDQNIEGGTRYLKYLMDLFETNLQLVVAAYNAGENAVMKYNNSIPPYPETQNYVKQVLALYNR